MNPWWFFGLTLLLEAPVVGWAWRGQLKGVVAPFLLLNLFTWPLLHYLMATTAIPVWQLEIGVWLAEGTGYALLIPAKPGKAFAVAGLANGLSYGSGLLITQYLL